MVGRAGFEDFEIVWTGDIFRDTPQTSDAAAFGTLGASYRAKKPA